MVLITFKTEQPFLANKDQVGCFSASIIRCNSIESYKHYTIIRKGQYKIRVLTDSILNTATFTDEFLTGYDSSRYLK